VPQTPVPPIPQPDDHLIGSRWVPAAGPSRTSVVNPTTEEVVTTLPDVTVAEADKAVAAARSAFDKGDWPILSVDQRATYVERFRRAIDARAEAVNAAWGIEAGMPVVVAQQFTQLSSLVGDDSIAIARSLVLSEFGDPRVMALLGALCVGPNALGFTNRSLRAQVSHLLGVAYTVNQASYDLFRLRSKDLIRRRPGTNTYDLTPDGQRVAIFYTKVHDRLLRPLIAADAPPAAPGLRRALETIDRHVAGYADRARLGKAA
jgi:hypothetical protein